MIKDENFLANTFYKVLMREVENEKFADLDNLWEVSKKLASMAQGRKSFARFYNSKEGRDARENSIK